MKHLLFRLLFAVLLLAAPAVRSQVVSDTWESINQRGYPAWFAEAKLGIFVHWGLYSVPAFSAPDGYAEWFYRGLMTSDSLRTKTMADIARLWCATQADSLPSRPTDQYRLLVPLWRAEHWNPDQWAQLFKASGARYVLLVTKHHDGYCLWDSPYRPDWNSVVSGPRRDIVGELTRAVRRAGLKMGFYYSLTEWTNPRHIWMQDPDDSIADYVDHYMIPQLKELITKYQPSALFADGEWQNSAAQFRAPEVIAWYYNTIGAEAIVNDRWGSGTLHGFKTPEYKGAIADTSRPWAECRGLGRSFALNRNEPLANYLTSDSLIRHFVRLVAAGGGMTLNVGPDADGTIPMLQQERLLDLGRWLSVNGEAIYASHPCRRLCTRDSTIFFTTRQHNLYAIATRLPDRELVLASMPAPPKDMQVTLLGTNRQLDWRYHDKKLIIRLDALTISDLAPLRSAWVFKLTNYTF